MTNLVCLQKNIKQNKGQISLQNQNFSPFCRPQPPHTKKEKHNELRVFTTRHRLTND